MKAKIQNSFLWLLLFSLLWANFASALSCRDAYLALNREISAKRAVLPEVSHPSIVWKTEISEKKKKEMVPIFRETDGLLGSFLGTPKQLEIYLDVSMNRSQGGLRCRP